jgi:hypothetical protein
LVYLIRQSWLEDEEVGRLNEQLYQDRGGDNRPISERFRIVAKAWCEADGAASLMEESKSSVLSEMISKILGDNLSLPYNKAELSAKSSPEYKEFITQMVQLRSRANLLKVKMEYLRMQFQEWSSHEANARAEKRL